jgi:hypothetical protein
VTYGLVVRLVHGSADGTGRKETIHCEGRNKRQEFHILGKSMMQERDPWNVFSFPIRWLAL